MMSCSIISKKDLFKEAKDHCRWKTVLNNVLLKSEFQEKNLYKFKNKSFNKILSIVYNICNIVKGIGILTIYDITSGICRFNNINIKKIYIIGEGPKRAIKLLNIKPKSKKIGKINLKYVEIWEILKEFKEKNYGINLDIKRSKNGDDFETFLCEWQKKK